MYKPARSLKVRTLTALSGAALAIAGCGLKTDYQLLEERRQSYLGSHPELDDPTKTAIQSGELKEGMTYEEVAATWGPPLYVNRFEKGRSVEWIYGCNYPGVCSYQEGHPVMFDRIIYHTRAYFYDGRLTQWRKI
jgi:hypothetical protein